MTVPHPPLNSGPTDPAPTQSTGGPDSLCTCDRGPVVIVYSRKLDEDVYFYRRCPECEKDKPLPFSISTLQELNRFMSWNLTEEGREYKRELEEKELIEKSSKSNRGGSKHERAKSIIKPRNKKPPELELEGPSSKT